MALKSHQHCMGDLLSSKQLNRSSKASLSVLYLARERLMCKQTCAEAAWAGNRGFPTSNGLPRWWGVNNPPASVGDAGDMGSTPESRRSPGGGNRMPPQYSCREHSMDRGAWWATVHGVTKSRTRLSTHVRYTGRASKLQHPAPKSHWPAGNWVPLDVRYPEGLLGESKSSSSTACQVSPCRNPVPIGGPSLRWGPSVLDQEGPAGDFSH